MKLIHLSDLHLGKRLKAQSLLEDQKYILQQILQIIDTEMPDAVLLAGDIYDKTVPPVEAVELFDEFLVQLEKRKTQVLVISGNHDSPERIAFGGRLMTESGIHMAPVYTGVVTPVTLRDDFGTVQIYMLPFLRPRQVRHAFDIEEPLTYTEAMEKAVEALHIDPEKRNVLMAHQFVTGAERSDSEEISVGGTDNVDAEVFEDFDYVALGHIHNPQKIGRETLRYCGSPLKYSFSEAGYQKSVTVVKLAEKGSVTVRTVPLKPRLDLREVRDTFAALTTPECMQQENRTDYLHIILTDEEEIPSAFHRLNQIYPNLMTMQYDNTRTRERQKIVQAEDVETVSPIALFSEFFEMQNNQPMTEQQRAYIQKQMEEIWEGRV